MNGFTAAIKVDDTWVPVHLAEVGLEDDPRRWRVEAPGERYDGWLVGDEELRVVLPAVAALKFGAAAGRTPVHESIGGRR